MSDVSIALLTWNRAKVFEETMNVSLRNTGMDWGEMVWTDNGSEPEQYERMKIFMSQFKVTAHVRYDHNTGMHRGFNTSLALSRSKYVVLIGPDVIMPDGWLKLFYDYAERIPDAGIVAMYTVPIEKVPERYRKNRNVETVNGLPVLRALPFDHFIIRRSIFQQVGYWREDFGLYGWSDVEWLERCEAILPKHGLNCYVIPNLHCNHLATAGAEEFRKENSPDYNAWKQAEAKLAHNTNLIQKCRAEGNPYYSPF